VRCRKARMRAAGQFSKTQLETAHQKPLQLPKSPKTGRLWTKAQVSFSASRQRTSNDLFASPSQ
jgi:hypothetical protein